VYHNKIIYLQPCHSDGGVAVMVVIVWLLDI